MADTEMADVGALQAGSKRKAEELLDETRAPRRIKALDPDVVNKIAAGEIIVAPVHALKELLENAVDAGSTSIEVLVKEGGLKLLQITDNGCGIQKDDLGILCERHTTSKISAFEDLAAISTYGFRGEALASISHIAHLTVTTKSGSSNVAWRAHYLNGKLAAPKPGQSAEPKPVAGRPGTQITVEDLFFNVPTRRRAFRSASDEFNKIIDMVGRYSVHRVGVGFSCKRHGESSANLAIQSGATAVDRIRQIYGSSVSNELVRIDLAEPRWGFRAEGWVTNANFHVKKTTMLLFINHRSVESSAVKKAVEQLYSTFLPKNGHPFVYLSLEIEPARVDVNVHPTKREVHFLNEDEIIQSTCEHLRSQLAAVDTSRTFVTQTLLPGLSLPLSLPSGKEDAGGTKAGGGGGPEHAKRQRRNSNSLVRTDATSRKITTMLSMADGPPDGSGSGDPSRARDDKVLSAPETIEYETTDREPITCILTSIKILKKEVRDDMHNGLTEIFRNHTFVGIVDERRRLAVIQGGVKLYLIDYGRACYEYFYQVGLTDFESFGVIRLRPALNLRELLRAAVEMENEEAEAEERMLDVEATVEQVSRQLIERRELMSDCFSLEISPAGELISIPMLMKDYTPPLVKLPSFLLQLGSKVNWEEEKVCFESFIHELACFYTPERLPVEPVERGERGDEQGRCDEAVPDEVRARRRNIRWAVEHLFFPAFRSRLVATTNLLKEGVMELADLKGLYRVFERC